MDGRHQRRTEQKAHPDHQRILKHGPCGVAKTRQQRENVQKNNYVGNGSNNENSGKHGPEYIFKTHVVEYIPIDSENQAETEKNQPDLRSLLQVLFKRVEKCFRKIPFFIFCNFQRDIIKRCC